MDPKAELLWARARLLAHEYERRAEELVPTAAAEAAIRKIISHDRNSWLSFPAKAAGPMAEALGADEGRMRAALERLIERHLSELGEVEVDLGDTEDGPQKRRPGTYHGAVRVR